MVLNLGSLSIKALDGGGGGDEMLITAIECRSTTCNTRSQILERVHSIINTKHKEEKRRDQVRVLNIIFHHVPSPFLSFSSFSLYFLMIPPVESNSPKWMEDIG